MPYIGRPLNAGNLAVQSGTGDGSDTTPIATLDYSVGSSNSIGVYLDGVRQLAGTDFTASGTVLTFTTAPANLVGIDVYFLGLELSIPTPADATVTTAKIAANAVDETKLKDALVADFTEVVVTASDSLLLGDATDSGNTKRDTVQGLLDLVSGLQVKVGRITRDITSATGVVAATGVGFQPKGLIFFAAVSDKAMASFGYCDADLTQKLIYDYDGVVDEAWSGNASNVLLLRENSAKYQLGAVSALGADGFSISWVKAGTTSAGSIQVNYMAFA